MCIILLIFDLKINSILNSLSLQIIIPKFIIIYYTIRKDILIYLKDLCNFRFVLKRIKHKIFTYITNLNITYLLGSI